MPRHATKTSFVKGDPRITGKKQSPEHIRKRREALMSREDFPELIKKLHEARNRSLEKSKTDGTLQKRIEKMNRARLSKMERYPEFRFRITEAANKRVRELMKQPNAPWRTPEYRRKQSLMKIGEKNPRIKTWQNLSEEEKLDWIQFMRRRSGKRPTAPEMKFIKLIEIHKLPIKYVGNGTFWIGHFNPDFIVSDGRKLLFEIYGKYWHNLPETKLKDKERMETYRRNGWKTMIIWEEELEDPEFIQRVESILQV